MATVFLGNTSPRDVPAGTQVHVNDEHVGGDEGTPRQGKTIVVITTPDTDIEGKKIGLGKKLLEIKNAFRIHSVEGIPAWVEAHDEDFAKAIADEFDIKVGRPEDWDPKEEEVPVREAEEHRNSTSFLGKVSDFLSDENHEVEASNEG